MLVQQFEQFQQLQSNTESWLVPKFHIFKIQSSLKSFSAQWRFSGATNERERIVIPFFSLLIKVCCLYLLITKKLSNFFYQRTCISWTKDALISEIQFDVLLNFVTVIFFWICRLSNGHINFEKFWQLAKQLTEFINWKQVVCPFEKNESIIQHLETTNVLDENTLALASFECEPPENNHEKDHLKILRSENLK